MPADELKIDQSFVRVMLEDDRSEKLVKTIIDLAHTFSLSVVGEGVEDKATAERLAELGCNVLQGFYYAEPLTADEFIQFMDGKYVAA